MAIKLITGVPGSGKTYYAIHHLITNYFTYNKERQEYLPTKELTIITNIDNLTLPHISLTLALQNAGKTIFEFFTVPYQEKISQKYKNIIYLLDEAQQFFPYKEKLPKETAYYFEYHRHLGHSVYIITQNSRLISQNIYHLTENEIYAVRRSLTILGELRYLVKSNNEIIDRILVKKNKKIFNLYKSMAQSETEAVKNPFKKYLLAGLLAFIVAVFLLYRLLFVRGFFPDPGQEQEKITQVPITQKIIPDLTKKKDDEPILTFLPVSYVRFAKELLLYDPLTKSLLPMMVFPYPVKYTTAQRNSLILAGFTPSQIEKINSQQSEQFPNGHDL